MLAGARQMADLRAQCEDAHHIIIRHGILSLDTAARPEGYWEMAAKPARPDWKRHELVSRAIFEALLKQSNAENLEVKHNVSKKGLKTAHQIDVFWKFRMGGLDHSVIVQVKKRRGEQRRR